MNGLLADGLSLRHASTPGFLEGDANAADSAKEFDEADGVGVVISNFEFWIFQWRGGRVGGSLGEWIWEM